MPEYRHGALYVVEDARDHRALEWELKQLDDRLFLERQISMDQVPVWCVVVHVGGDHPPITILEYRDDQNQPIELSGGIIERVRRMDRDGARLAARAIQANKDLTERRRQRSLNEYREIERDMQPRIDGRVRPVLPRSQSLRLMRDKKRAKGWKV